MASSFLLLHVIANEKTLKFKQIDRLPALPRFQPQKHVPTTLVGIPVDIYPLSELSYTRSNPNFIVRRSTGLLEALPEYGKKYVVGQSNHCRRVTLS